MAVVSARSAAAISGAGHAPAAAACPCSTTQIDDAWAPVSGHRFPAGTDAIPETRVSQGHTAAARPHPAAPHPAGAAYPAAARRISPTGPAHVNLPLRAAALPPQSILGEASEGAAEAPSEAKP